MKKFLLGILGTFLLLPLSSWASDRKNKCEKIVVNIQEEGARVPSSLFGVFFEEINHAGDGGLYAEMVKNRSFENLEIPAGYTVKGKKLIPPEVKNHLTGKVFTRQSSWSTDPVPSWELLLSGSSSAEMKLTKENPRYNSAPNNLRININEVSNPIHLINEGYWGMNIQPGQKYILRTIIRVSNDYKGTVIARLIAENGEQLASESISLTSVNQWQDVQSVLISSGKDSKARLLLEFNDKGTIWLDYVSLFPENTFKNRENGLRKDLAETIQELKPSFVRWPGGSIVGGITLETRFDWKKTLGDPAMRTGEYITWGYQSTYGFGYHEFLQFCEDIGAQGMYVSDAGIACQFRSNEACPENEIQFYIDHCLDAIEYALGGVHTEWGAKRAAAGHPESFPLGYVEVGNENWGPEYDRRYDMFYKAIKEKYPQLTVISNHLQKGIANATETDMIDPHWYGSPGFFFNNANLFDDYPRGKYEIYVGEYACNAASVVKNGNMNAALSEAAFLTGIERNSDLVTMTSYAPLLQNRNTRNWPVNLIWFDTDQVVGRSSYYVQKMAAENRPDYNVKHQYTGSSVLTQYKKGKIGFGSSKTPVEFKDIQITENGKPVSFNLAKHDEKQGDWNIESGFLKQTAITGNTRYVLGEIESNNFILECKARKSTYDNGFVIYFGLTNDEQKGFMYSIGSFNSETVGVDQLTRGSNSDTFGNSSTYYIFPDKWYDLKLVVTPQKSKLYINGEPVLSHTPYTTPNQFISSGIDEQTGELILKVVNRASDSYSPTISLNGTKNVNKTGRVTTLFADNLNEENSFEEPHKIYPKESMFNRFDKTFTYEFKPYSYTILRIPVTK